MKRRAIFISYLRHVFKTKLPVGSSIDINELGFSDSKVNESIWRDDFPQAVNREKLKWIKDHLFKLFYFQIGNSNG